MDKEVLTITECSQMLGLSRPTLYKIISTDSTFPATRVGRKKFLVPKGLLHEWVINQTKYRK